MTITATWEKPYPKTNGYGTYVYIVRDYGDRSKHYCWIQSADMRKDSTWHPLFWSKDINDTITMPNKVVKPL